MVTAPSLGTGRRAGTDSNFLPSKQHRPLERSAMAQEMSFRDVQVSSSEIRIREIGLKDLWQALKDGFADVGAKPSVVVAFLIEHVLELVVG